MEKLGLKEHAIMSMLYRSSRKNWYVRTPNCSAGIIKRLYDTGLIMTDRLFQGQPTRFKITEAGEDYGRQHCSTDKGTTDK